jgi:MFS family permease
MSAGNPRERLTRNFLRRLPERLRGWLPRHVTGGQPVDPPHGRAMSCFYGDGVFSAASEAFVGPYISVYMLALGASASQIGLLASLTNLVGMLAFIPGARLAERVSSHRDLIVTISIGARLVLLLLALVAGLHSPAWAIIAVIALASLRAGLSNLANPAWTAMCARIVPEKLRGRYFSRRNFDMSLLTAVLVPLAGRVIGALGTPRGYQVSFAIALALGLASSWAYSRIPSLPVEPAEQLGKSSPHSWQQALANLRRYPDFVRFTAIAIVLGLSVQVTSPYYNVYMVRNLGMDVVSIGIFAAANSVGDLVGQRIFGPLVDKHGLRWVMSRCAPVIAITPATWLLVRQPWHIIPIQIVSAAAWAGYNLGAFNYLLAACPTRERPLYSALYNVCNTSTAMVGPLLGGLVFNRWGFRTDLWLSAAGRGLAALLTILFLREVSERFAHKQSTV